MRSFLIRKLSICFRQIMLKFAVRWLKTKMPAPAVRWADARSRLLMNIVDNFS